MLHVKTTVMAIALILAQPALAQTVKPALSDPQIAHIAYTADALDIKLARLAEQKTQNKDVKAFAEDMIRDHTAVNDKATALLKKLGVQPQDNNTSRALTKQADEEYKKLEAMKGAAFDRAYVTNEVAFHKTVNDSLRTALIPSAKNGELKDLLSTGLKIFEGHQQHAEQLAKELK